ncbi:hypothetical protein acsn021_16710 [Anaerocolumna cellulosilytica]|uniref:Uncharacterized protein n=1 Tax=Anaerocolumna cellulosilytica TaxID=433286 RepID=A0A6S6R3M6_9FIRM|nr:DUF503 domain-containing protein [Anaerocolumna cellulosilytica]MBB5194935.1 hypothetical protein [Anaerocolumna cellulosilytica]BCJ94102.1 hypothetical protein acsn021_16710 [Anaerocolumna cellulosilytica]
MIIGTMRITIHTPWVHSLKEKRMVVKSLCAKIHNKFNVSVAEVDEQDTHQTVVLGIAGVAGDTSQADSILDHVLQYTEGNTEGEVISVERELL